MFDPLGTAHGTNITCGDNGAKPLTLVHKSKSPFSSQFFVIVLRELDVLEALFSLVNGRCGEGDVIPNGGVEGEHELEEFLLLCVYILDDLLYEGFDALHHLTAQIRRRCSTRLVLLPGRRAGGIHCWPGVPCAAPP